MADDQVPDFLAWPIAIAWLAFLLIAPPCALAWAVGAKAREVWRGR